MYGREQAVNSSDYNGVYPDVFFLKHGQVNVKIKPSFSKKGKSFQKLKFGITSTPLAPLIPAWMIMPITRYDTAAMINLSRGYTNMGMD
jgi:hypothetical protein